MRLKQCIFALVAMLLCAFSANAQGGSVAKIGSTEYTTFAEALTAASEMSGDVTIEVYDKVTLNTAFSGSYSSINFVGKDTDAEIYLDVQGYITATGKKVSFTDLTLSKSAGVYITNAGFMNVAFGIYDVVEVAYTNCKFANGAYASSGNVTFNGCTFYRSHDKYGLWAYGNVDVAVEGCTFADYRGIKMYAEGAAKTVDLTVKNTNFSAVTDKPAIVLTYGESVVLEGNTYSSTGTFELDLDGAPNGTAVTSDVAPTCKNDNGTCGVLVDGKIYTTVAQAAAVATEGSNVTLLYSTTDAVEFAEGVNLTLANGVTADNVTVATSGVAKIGDTTYATFAEALTAASAMSGDVTIEVYDKVILNTAFSGSYSSINFVGKDTDAEIYLDVQGYITATGKKVSFTDLTLSKSAGVYITNAGFMNVAFGIYDVVEVAYTNCKFANGAYASSGNVTFNGCTFYRSHDKYGLWAYGDVNATVEGCTFADYRGIKMYAEGAAKTVDLTVKNTDFSAVTDKPAIVLTYGESVVLEGNTYSSTGTFELDLDGAPNGTAVTSDVAPTCKNDNGTCGVLVDGNIYTTVAQAAEVAAAGSNVTLLYSTTDTVEFAEGVNLTLANGVTADNVTVATSAVAKIGDTTYATLAEAVAAATEGATITMLADAAEDATLPAGVKFNGNGKAVGNLIAGGEITFTGVTKATSFGVQYTNTTVNIVPGACLEITGSGRMVIGHGCTFNITGNIENAKTADVAALTPSLIMPGASFTGAGVTFNVTNAYIKATAYCSSKNSSANGTFNFNVTNSVWEQANTLVFSAPTNGMDPTFNLNLVNSVLNSTSHLVFAVTKGEIVFDNSNVNVGTSRQIENQSTMTIKNGAVVNGAVATSSNAKNPGTIIVDNATYAVTGEFSGSDLGTGTLIVKKGATVSAGSITKANIQIDATGMAAGDEINLTADLSKLAGTIEVVNNNLDASIVDGKIVLSSKSLEGEGTAENPYLIETLKDLKFFRDDVNTYTQDGSNQYKGKYVKLTADIDLAGENWEPIGKNSNGDHQNFLGTFYGEKADGTKPTISNLYINADGDYLGFFARVGSYAEGLTPTVKNIKFNNVDVSSNTTNSHGGSYVAGVIANAGGNSVVSGIEVTGDVYVVGYGYIGGIVGHGYPDIDNCHVAANDGSYINSHYWCVGGIIGYAGEGGTPITNSSVSGVDIWSASGAAAAIAGLLNDGNKLENVSASNVEITSNSDYCMGYIAGNGNASTMTGISIENVTATAKGNPITPTDAVAKVNDAIYFSLQEAFAAAAEGETITLLADATPALTSQRAITKAAVIDLGGNTLTLTEDDLYFGTTTFKNGTIVVDPSVKPSTAVFWMFANQTLTFDAVKVVATGVTGTYLIGLDGNNSDLNLLNGSEILIENTTALDLDVICVNASTGNDIVVENSKVNVTNLDGRVFFRGNYTVKDSEVSLAGITKAGFRIEAGQTLSIEGTSTVTIEGEPRDGGIHITDATATYTKAETATVNATVNAPAPAYVAQVGDAQFETLAEAVAAVEDGGTITMIANETFTENNRYDNGGWWDGLGYSGDKSFTIDLNNFTISQDGALNDYLMWFKNDGAKENTITLKNGTLDAGTTAYSALATASSNAQKITVNLENIKVINNNSNGAALKIRGGAELNVKAGTEITGKDSYLGIQCSAATVNIYDGAKIYMNGTSSYCGCLAGASGGGTVNVYGGYGKGAKGGFIAMTSGGTINIEGGEWIANTDGSIGNNSNVYVLTAQSNINEQGFVGPAIINVTGGTFRGGMDAWVLNNHKDEKAELNISGGNFNADPATYLAQNYAALPDLNGNYVVGVKPTATVNNLGMTTIAAGDYSIWNGRFDQNTEDDGDMPLSFVMQFLADQDAEDMETSPFADWYGDFVITFTGLKNGSFTADGCYLAGHYGSFGWVKVPVDGKTIEEGARYPVMLGVGLGQKYDYICSSVEDFKCALYLTPEILEANPNIEVKLELAVVDNSKGSDAAANALVNNDKVYSVTEYTYDAEDFVVDPNYIAELVIDDAEGENYTNDTEKRVGTLTYKRTLFNGKWNALYLPFEVELTDELLANYDFADYNQMISHDTNGDRVPDSFEMELFIYTGGTLDANYPYFVRPKNEEACSLNLVLADATLYPAKENSIVTTSVKNIFKLSGTYSAMDAAALAGKYAISIDGDWSYSEALKPYRLYLTITDNNGAVVASGASKSVRIVVRGEDGFTGIEDVTDENVDEMIYDLQGRRILEPQKGEMYIINGKKVIY